QAFGVDADSRPHPGVTVGQLQAAGGVPRMGGLFADPHDALRGQAVQHGVPVGVEGPGRIVGVGVEDGAGRGVDAHAWGASFPRRLTSQMPAQTRARAARYCHSNRGSPLSRADSRTLTTGLTRPNTLIRLTGLFFISRAHKT